MSNKLLERKLNRLEDQLSPHSEIKIIYYRESEGQPDYECKPNTHYILVCFVDEACTRHKEKLRREGKI